MSEYYPPVSILKAGLGCRCPRCAGAPLFRGFLTIQDSCPACGLDYAKVDSGDGPAVFIILIVGLVVVGLALWVELTWSPPEWVHLLLWTPVTLVLSLLLLRPFKATLIALQYRHKATQDIELV